MSLFGTVNLKLIILLPLTGPLAAITLFLNLTNGVGDTRHGHRSLVTSICMFTVVVITCCTKRLIVSAFNVSVPNLQVTNNLVITFVNFQVLFPRRGTVSSPRTGDGSRRLRSRPDTGVTFIPLTVPDATNPKAVTVVVDSTSAIHRDSAFTS